MKKLYETPEMKSFSGKEDMLIQSGGYDVTSDDVTWDAEGWQK